MLRTMCEIINLFVDGEITTNEQAVALLYEETEGEPKQPAAVAALALLTAESAMYLLPPMKAAHVVGLLTPPLPKEE